jgi:ABC-type multidrug transport system ATPase subunit
LRDTPILILDEPTANLDVEAEAEVMRALETLVEGRTVLMISHRLSTLGQVDEIIVLHKGRIVERGTYSELKAAGGLFAYLLAEQNRYNLDHREDQVPRRPARGPADAGPQSASSSNGRRPRVRLLKRRGLRYRIRTRPNGSLALPAQGTSTMYSTDHPLDRSAS